MSRSVLREVDGYLEVALPCGSLYKVDICDKPLFEYLDWYNGHYGYLQIKVQGHIKRYHRLISNCPEGLVVDHINRDTKDNRRVNLRNVTKQQNSINQPNTTGNYKGVSWSKHAKKWRATAKLDNKTKHLGYFELEEEAAKAYDMHILENFPEHGYLNVLSRK